MSWDGAKYTVSPQRMLAKYESVLQPIQLPELCCPLGAKTLSLGVWVSLRPVGRHSHPKQNLG